MSNPKKLITSQTERELLENLSLAFLVTEMLFHKTVNCFCCLVNYFDFSINRISMYHRLYMYLFHQQKSGVS